MSTFNYENARLTATKLISKFGAAGSFVIKGNDGGYDDDGNVIAPTPNVTISGTVTPALQYKSMEIDGSTVQTGDSYVFFDSATDIPIGAIITLNGNEFKAVNSTTLKSVAGVKVYQKIQLRR